MNHKFKFLVYLLLILTSCTRPATTTPGEQDEDSQTEGPSTPTGQVRIQAPNAPKNVIIMIGDGMGLTHITAGMIANGNKLHLERCSSVGLIKTYSSDNLITDSAAGATAFASGIKTYNGAIGVDDNQNPVETILEIAAKNNLSTALIASSSITHATPACFFSHQPSRTLDEAIAQDLVNSDVDIFIGGGRDFFTYREDGNNLINDLKVKNFKIYENIESVPNEDQKVGVFIAGKQPVSYLNGRRDFLPVATQKTLELLELKNTGFFLMVEGSQIDWFGHSNASDSLITEMIDFDNAIGKVLDYAEKDGETLVIITADHETGGYAIVGGDIATGLVEGKFNTGGHTGTMIPVFAYGPGSENFSGIYENTAIFHKILELWDIGMIEGK